MFMAIHGRLWIAVFGDKYVLNLDNKYDLFRSLKNGMDEVYGIVIASYNVAKYHNAPQLESWCLHFMSTNYNKLCKQAGKEMDKHLDEESRKYLEEHRWPPIWYLKEQDFYERSMRQYEKELVEMKTKKRSKRCGGCFRP